MKKAVILATDNHNDYVSCYRYVVKAWNSLGWDTLCFYVTYQDEINSAIGNASIGNKIINIKTQNGYGTAILSQVYRLLGHHYLQDYDMIMTSDIDMMPLSDYWKPDSEKINCYGQDLTNYVHYPICYIAANTTIWNSLVPENDIYDLLSKYPCSRSNKFDDYWYTDQNIITERIKNCNLPINNIKRGFNNYHLATGRIDRILFSPTFTLPEIKIDCHLPRPFNESICKLLLQQFHNCSI